MKNLDPRFLVDFFSALTYANVKAKPEHVARHSYGLQIEVEYLTSEQRFTCLLNTGSVAFLKRGDQQIELILPEAAPEHVGWAVSSLDDFEKLYAHLITDKNPRSFTLLPDFNINRDDLKAVMFKHNESEAVVQIVCRKEPIFPL
jgi:hypothetical protein